MIGYHKYPQQGEAAQAICSVRPRQRGETMSNTGPVDVKDINTTSELSSEEMENVKGGARGGADLKIGGGGSDKIGGGGSDKIGGGGADKFTND